jgi:hypothetical protein
MLKISGFDAIMAGKKSGVFHTVSYEGIMY